MIGATATGVGTPQVTPIDSAMAPVLTLAHSVSSILNEDFFIVPEWEQQLDEVRGGEVVLLIVGLVLTLILIGIFVAILRHARNEK